MQIYLAHVPEVPEEYSHAPTFRQQLRTQRAGSPIVDVDDPAAADLILFTECHQLPSDWRLQAIVNPDIAHAYPDRIAVYDERDRPWCSLPGIYVSMPHRRFNPQWQVAGSYWLFDEPAQRLDVDFVPRIRYLYSFVGNQTHKCREAIFSLPSDRAYIERVQNFVFFDPSSPRFEERRRRFAEVTLESSFVLCPRGVGLSSIRLYEVMAAGRTPVIIADGWVPPIGPNWDSFSIRWPESKVARLPAELRRREGEAAAMGLRARQEFDQWFARDVALTRQIEQLGQLLSLTPRSQFPRSGIRDAQFFKVWRDDIAVSWRKRALNLLRPNPVPAS